MSLHRPSLAQLPSPPPGKTGFPWTLAKPATPAIPSTALPRISIVTPSFNQHPFIEETLRSVLAQNYPNLEYLVLDGGSHDGSVEIIRRYAPWLDYWASEQDHGQADAINRGWQRATGEIVAWLNSDDTYLPGALTAVAQTFLDQPAVALVFGDCNIVDAATQVLEVIRPRAVDVARILLANPIPQPATFIRRRALEQVGFLDPGFRYTMDHELWVRLARQFRFAYIPRPLANFRMYRGTKSVSELEGFLPEYIAIYERAAQDPRTAPLLPASAPRRQGLAHYNLGVAYYGRGEMSAARRHWVWAARLDPGLLIRSRLILGFAKTFLGSQFTHAVRHWRDTRHTQK